VKKNLFVFVCMLFLSTTVFAATVEITCQKSFYTPDVIHAKLNEPLTIILKSQDVTHGFAIDAFKVAQTVSHGNPVTIQFTPDKTGTFYYYCVVRCGKKHLQMRGTLIVE
jgi:heme/copper-type cytochrome/quinol oxidase subunit 2